MRENLGLLDNLYRWLRKGQRRRSRKVDKPAKRRLLMENLETRNLLSAGGLTVLDVPPVIVSQGVTNTGAPLMNASVDSAGQATFSTSSLGVGAHPIQAKYDGDACHAASTSAALDPEIELISDPALAAAVRKALGLPAGAVLTEDEVGGLTTLVADSNKVFSLQGLDYATNLQSLSLVPSDFSVPGHLTVLSPLAGLTQLKTLVLQDCGLNTSLIGTLPSLPALQTLDLRYNNNATNKITTVPAAVANQPNLASLLLYGNSLNTNPVSGSDPTPTWCDTLRGRLLRVDIAPQDTTGIIASIVPAGPTAATTAATFKALAAAFYNLPLEIYQYVVNTIQYQPYMGAMKGPLAVLETGAGNDWDTDWLLTSLLAQVGSSVSTTYVSGQIEVPIQQAEQYVGALDPWAAYNILNKAGQAPNVGEDGSGEITAMRFNHTWVQAQVSTPAGPVTMKLDPSWKLRDFQTGTAALPAGTDLLALSGGGFDSSAYVATTQEESAAEYYESQIRQFLASNYPTQTVADVPYDGPIHQQRITAPPTELPYEVVTSTEDLVVAATVPPEKENKVEIRLDGGTNLFDQSFYVPDISLSRLTVDPNLSVSNGNNVAQPRLLLDGSLQATSASPVTWSTTAPAPLLTLTIIVTSPDSSRSYTCPYTRGANRYMAIGLDANQMSDQLLVSRRATVNAQELLEANNPPSVNQDSLIGGVLALALTTYFDEADRGEKSIVGLTGAVQDYSWIACGMATSGTAIDDLSSLLQMPYQPSSMSLDVPYNNWSSLPISKQDAQGVNRDLLLGYHNSSMEGLVWEELTNYDSISTVRAFQEIQQAHPGSFYTITSSNENSDLSGVLHYSAGDYAILISHIKNFIDNQGYAKVYVPTYELTIGNNNPQGPWTGIGYTVINSWGFTVSYIIDGRIGATWQSPHGGAPDGDFVTPKTPPEPVNGGVSVSDPIDAATGDVSHNELDFSVPNLGAALQMLRRYDSINTVASGAPWSDRGMGEGWSFTYSDKLVSPAALNDPADLSDPSGELIWFTAQGIELKFAYTGSVYNTPAGIFGTLTHDSVHHWYVWTDSLGAVVRFDDGTGGGTSGRLLYELDRYGDGVNVSYVGGTAQIDKVHRVVNNAIVSSDCYIKFNYSGNDINSITAHDSIADNTGRTWNYGYNGAARLTSLTAPSDANTPLAVTRYDYYTDPVLNGLLKSFTDPDGNMTQFAYYVNRRGFQVTDAAGNVQSVSHDLFCNRTDFTDNRGVITSYTYDSQGHGTGVYYADGTAETAQWYTSGLKQSDTDSYGQTTSYTYDANGNLTSLVDALGETTSYTYTDYGNPLTVTRQSDGAVTRYTYFTDSLGKNSSVASVTDADGNVTTYTYPGQGSNPGTNAGEPASVTSPKGQGLSCGYTTWYSYNAAGQTTAEFQPLTPANNTPPTDSNHPQYIESSSYFDNRGDLLYSTDGNGVSLGDPAHTTSYLYDLLGRVRSMTQPVPDPMDPNPLPAPVTSYAYDAAGNLLSTTLTTSSPQRSTSVVYDSMGRVVKTTDADTTYTTEEYDASGSLVYSTDALGRVTQYVYDSRDRRIATINPDGSMVRTQLDGGGRAVATTDANGNTTRYAYDKLGRTVQQVAPNADVSQAATLDDTSAWPSFTMTVGSWSASPAGSGGYGGEYIASTAASASAAWTFTAEQGVTPGAYYEVFVTWAGDRYNPGSNTSKAIYTVYDGLIARGTVTVDQQSSPTPNATFSDAAWQSLGWFYVSGTTLKIALANGGVGTLVADAVKIVQVTPSFTGYDSRGNVKYVTVGGLPDDRAHSTDYLYDAMGRTTQTAAACPEPLQSEPLGNPRTNLTGNPNVDQFYNQWAIAGAGDFNGDGKADLLWENMTTGDVGVWTTGGDWQFLGNVDPTVWRIAGVGDFNGDGRADILWQDVKSGDGNYGMVGVWITGGALQWLSQADPAVWRIAGVGDFNGDGKADVLWQDKLPSDGSYGMVGIWITGGPLQWLSRADPTVWKLAGVGDFNGDGKADVLWQDVKSGDGSYGMVGVWITGGPLQWLSQADPTVWKLAGVGDFNGDGTADVLWQDMKAGDGSYGYVAVWITGGPMQWFSYADPTLWGIVGTGDFGSDSRADILWQGVKTGDANYGVALSWLTGAGGLSRPTTYYHYDPNGNLDGAEDARGNPPSNPADLGAFDGAHTTKFLYDESNRKTATILPDPSGGTNTLTTSYVYDSNSNLTAITTPGINAANTLETDYTFDHLSRRIEEIRPDPATGATSASDPNCPKTFWTYDQNGRLALTKDPDGNTTAYGYNLEGRRTTVTDALGDVATTVYDTVGNVLSVTTPSPNLPVGSGPDDPGVTTFFQYDSMDRKIAQVSPLPLGEEQAVKEISVPGMGQVIVGGGPTATWQYDANGNVTAATNPLGNTTRTDYNGWNQPIDVTDALGGETTTTYDAWGRVSAVTDPLGRTTAYRYDDLGRKTAEIRPAATTTVGGGTQTMSSMNLLNSQMSSSSIAGDYAATPATPLDGTTTMAFNGENLTSDATGPVDDGTMTFFGPSDPASAGIGTSGLVQFGDLGEESAGTALDAAPMLAGGAESAGTTLAAMPLLVSGGQAAISPTTYYGYDADGNLKYVTDPRGATIAGGLGAGSPGYTTWYYYDTLNRPVATIDAAAGLATDQGMAGSPPSPLTHATVTSYDKLGDVSTVTQSVNGATTRITAYHYDYLGRETAEIDPQVTDGRTGLLVTPTTAYAYDLNGNQLWTTDADNHTSWTVYDALNRPWKSVSADGSGPTDTHYATTTVYDAAGNVTSVTDPDGNTTRYVYDNLSREVGSTNALSYTSSRSYDADGNLLQQIDYNGRTTKYLYDALNRQTEEDWLDAGGSVFHAITTHYDADSEVLGVTETDTATALHTADPASAPTTSMPTTPRAA